MKEPIRVTNHEVPASLACIPDRFDAEFSENECWLTGWGLTNVTHDDIPNILQEAKVHVWTHEECIKAVETVEPNITVIFDSSLCVGSKHEDLPNACFVSFYDHFNFKTCLFVISNLRINRTVLVYSTSTCTFVTVLSLRVIAGVQPTVTEMASGTLWELCPGVITAMKPRMSKPV